MDFLFGAETPLAVRFFIAFVIVLGLIGGTAYLVRRFGADRLGAASARGRQPRLAVIDAAAVDGRRRLVLIRRDNVEHLLMIGGPTDVVVEPNIVRAAAAPREAAPPRPSAAPADTLPRAVPLGEGSMWPLQPHSEPTPPPPPPVRPRQPIVEEPMQWHPEPEPPPPPRPRPEPRPVDPLAGLAAELARQPMQEPAPRPRPVREREAPRMPERARSAAPAIAPPPPVEDQFASPADQNLAEMAQRLEAALRRPKPAEARGAPDPAARQQAAPEPLPVAEAVAPEPDEQPLPAPTPRAESKPAPKKSVYDSLEQEMASLLGRPTNKT